MVFGLMIGFVIGALFGIMSTALLVAARDGDPDG